MPVSLKVAELYADLVIRTAEFDRQMSAIQGKMSRFQAPKLGGSGGGIPDQLFPVAKLQASGLKYQDTIAKEAAKVERATKAAQDRISKAQASSTKARPQVVSLGSLQVSGLRLQDQITREAEKAARAAAVVQEKIAKAQARVAARGPEQFVSLGSLQVSGLNLQDKLAADAEKKSGRKTDKGRALMEFSRAAEDAQYGINGILNNIPSLVQSLGGGYGLIGAISLASVGAYQLYKNWDSVAAAFGGDATRTQAQELAELAKQTSLTADQAERLARAGSIGKKIDELRGYETKEQRESDAAVTEAIGEAGLKNVVAGILKTNPTLVDAQGSVPKAMEDKKKVEKNLASYMTEEGRTVTAGGDTTVRPISPEVVNSYKAKLVEADIAINEARKETAAQIASTGGISQFFPGGLDQLRKMVESNPAAFGPKGVDFLASLKAAAPGKAEADKKLMEEYANAQEDAAADSVDKPLMPSWESLSALQGLASRFGFTADRAPGEALQFGMHKGNPLANGLGRMAMGGLMGGLGGLMNVAGGANQLSGGLFGEAAMAAFKDRSPDLRFGGSGADFGQRLQQDILDKKRTDALEKIGNTTNQTLAEIRDNLKGGIKNVAGAILGPS